MKYESNSVNDNLNNSNPKKRDPDTAVEGLHGRIRLHGENGLAYLVPQPETLATVLPKR